MLNSDGIENNNKKTALTTTGLTSKENNFAHAAHFFFLDVSLPLLLHDYNVKLSSLFMEEMLYVLTKNKLLLVFLFTFFCTAINFHLTGC